MAQNITPKEGEEILATVRKSFSVLTKQIAIILVFVILSLTLVVLAINFYLSVTALLVLLAALIYGFYHFVIWYYDLYIVTNHRAILINQKGLFSRELSEVPLVDIASTKYQTKGIVATMLKHGDVIIITVDGIEHTLTNIVEPDYIRELISTAAAAARKM